MPHHTKEKKARKRRGRGRGKGEGGQLTWRSADVAWGKGWGKVGRGERGERVKGEGGST